MRASPRALVRDEKMKELMSTLLLLLLLPLVMMRAVRQRPLTH